MRHFPLVLSVLYLGVSQSFFCRTRTQHHSYRNSPSRRILPSFLPTALDLSKDADREQEVTLVNATLVNEATIEFRLHSSIASIAPEAWNACLPTKEQGVSSAFLDYSWFHCLEESKCASPQTGWSPQHISIKVGGETKGFVPLYIKGNSSESISFVSTWNASHALSQQSSTHIPSHRSNLVGEFIFDSAWADAAYQNDIDYYPKMLVAVPFTPATGGRFLWHPSIFETYSASEIRQLRKTTANFLRQIATGNKISSVHINFLADEEATDLAGPFEAESKTDKGGKKKSAVESFLRKLTVKDDYIRRSSIQYHWSNCNLNNDGKPYESFDDYLGCFKSKRRINIRRERRKVTEEGIRIDAVRGREILQYPGLVNRMYEIYLSTIQKMYFGNQYLTMDFFEKLAESDFIDHLCFMCARYNSTGEELRADDVFAGTFNVVKDGIFYGRYWGCLGEEEVKNLHFETCYWSAIEYCIDKGIHRMEPGAGGGDYKW
jgi:predicted N-acyltransferase